MNTRAYSQRRCPGFTLVEMVVVIVITGVIAASVAVFLRQPVQGYVDAARRAEISDIADTSLRRMVRDLRLALPNSVRVTDGGKTLELLLTRTGGRYRTEGVGFLDFSQATTSFAQLGPLSNGLGMTIVAGDKLVIYNLGIKGDIGIPGADAYSGDNSADIISVNNAVPNEPVFNFSARKFHFESPDARFQVVAGPVSYVCDTATGRLLRYAAYPINPEQPTAVSLAASSAQRALAANNVAACGFSYTPGVTARSGVAALSLKISLKGESVQLYQEAHVSNVP